MSASVSLARDFSSNRGGKSLQWGSPPELTLNGVSLVDFLSSLEDRLKACEKSVENTTIPQPSWFNKVMNLLDKLMLDQQQQLQQQQQQFQIVLSARDSAVRGEGNTSDTTATKEGNHPSDEAPPRVNVSSKLSSASIPASSELSLVSSPPDASPPNNNSEELSSSPAEEKSTQSPGERGEDSDPKAVALSASASSREKRFSLAQTLSKVTGGHTSKHQSVPGTPENSFAAANFRMINKAQEEFMAHAKREMMRLETSLTSLRSLFEKKSEIQELRDSSQDEMLTTSVDSLRVLLDRKPNSRDIDTSEAKLMNLVSQTKHDLAQRIENISGLEQKITEYLNEQFRALTARQEASRSRQDARINELSDKVLGLLNRMMSIDDKVSSVEGLEDYMLSLATQVQDVKAKVEESREEKEEAISSLTRALATTQEELYEKLEKAEVEVAQKMTETVNANSEPPGYTLMKETIEKLLTQLSQQSEEILQVKRSAVDGQTGLRNDVSSLQTMVALQQQRVVEAKELGNVVQNQLAQVHNEASAKLNELEGSGQKAAAHHQMALEQQYRTISSQLEDQKKHLEDQIYSTRTDITALVSSVRSVLGEERSKTLRLVEDFSIISAKMTDMNTIVQEKVPPLAQKTEALSESIKVLHDQARTQNSKLDTTREHFEHVFRLHGEKIEKLDQRAGRTAEGLQGLTSRVESQAEACIPVNALVNEKRPLLLRLTKPSFSIRSFSVPEVDEEVNSIITSATTKCLSIEKSGKSHEVHDFITRTGQQLAALLFARMEFDVVKRSIAKDAYVNTPGAAAQQYILDIHRQFHEAKAKYIADVFQRLATKVNMQNPDPVQPVQEERAFFINAIVKVLDLTLHHWYTTGESHQESGFAIVGKATNASAASRSSSPPEDNNNHHSSNGSGAHPHHSKGSLSISTKDEGSASPFLSPKEGIRPFMITQGTQNYIYKGGFRMPNSGSSTGGGAASPSKKGLVAVSSPSPKSPTKGNALSAAGVFAGESNKKSFVLMSGAMDQLVAAATQGEYRQPQRTSANNAVTAGDSVEEDNGVVVNSGANGSLAAAGGEELTVFPPIR